MGLWDGGFGAVEVRRVQPYEATKAYVCPGCHRDIPSAPGTTSRAADAPTFAATGTRPAGIAAEPRQLERRLEIWMCDAR